MSHHAGGVPIRILAEQHVGPYVASVWARREVGMANVYVVLESPEGSTFVPPTSVRVAVAPVSGRLAEQVVNAHEESVRSGARYVSDVMFDRAERWNVRVLIDAPTPAGGGQLVAQIDAVPDAMHGGFGLALSSLPFVLMAAVWWRAAALRRAPSRASLTTASQDRSRPPRQS